MTGGETVPWKHKAKIAAPFKILQNFNVKLIISNYPTVGYSNELCPINNIEHPLFVWKILTLHVSPPRLTLEYIHHLLHSCLGYLFSSRTPSPRETLSSDTDMNFVSNWKEETKFGSYGLFGEVSKRALPIGTGNTPNHYHFPAQPFRKAKYCFLLKLSSTIPTTHFVSPTHLIFEHVCRV